jgi:hypothetical protein
MDYRNRTGDLVRRGKTGFGDGFGVSHQGSGVAAAPSAEAGLTFTALAAAPGTEKFRMFMAFTFERCSHGRSKLTVRWARSFKRTHGSPERQR